MPFRERPSASILKYIYLWMGRFFHFVSYPINNKSYINVVIVKKNSRHLGNEKKLENEVLNPRLLSVRNQKLTHLLKAVTTWSVWPLYRTRIITRAKNLFANSLYWRCWPPIVPSFSSGGGSCS